MSIGEVCNREVVFARRSDTVLRAAELMRTYHVGSLVVVEAGSDPAKPLGIVTDRDLVVEVMAERVAPEDVAVGDVMSYGLVTAREDEGVWDVILRMRARGVRRLPIVDGDGALVGIVTMDDMLELLSGELSALVTLTRREQAREEAVRSRA